MLYDAGRDKGLAIAERIRMAFEDAAAEIEGRPIGGTVSMGMVIAEANLFDIPALLAQADEALYCAKERGRNRVEVASLQQVLERAKAGRGAQPDACARGGIQRRLIHSRYAVCGSVRPAGICYDTA